MSISISIHRIEKIELGEVTTTKNDNGKTICFCDLIITTNKGKENISLFADSEDKLKIVEEVRI